MGYQQEVFALLSKLSGSRNKIVVDRAFCEFMGSLEGGVFLSQLLYWCDKGSDEWFYKSSKEWYGETFLSEYQVRQATKRCVELGFLETKLKRANGAPTQHYKVDGQKFVAAILKNFSIDSEKFRKPIPKNSRMDSEKFENVLTEITTETTTEREEAPPPPQREMQSDAPPEPDSVQDVPLTPTIEKHLEEALDTPRKQHRVFIKAKEQYADGKFLDGGDMGMTFQKECNALFEEWREVTDEQNKLPLLTDEQLWEEQREEIKELAKHRAAPADLRGVLEAMYQKDFMARTAGFWRTGVPYIRVGVAAKYLQSWKAQKSATPKPAVPVPSYHRKVLGRDEFGELIYETPEGALP